MGDQCGCGKQGKVVIGGGKRGRRAHRPSHDRPHDHGHDHGHSHDHGDGSPHRVAVRSVTEGEDQPLKHPPIFAGAHVLVIDQIDRADAVGFDRATPLASMRRVAPQATVLEVSARTGQGMELWYALRMKDISLRGLS